MIEERRTQERFRIDCPVFVASQDLDKDMVAIKGKLLDIGSRGARFLVYESLEVGSRVVMELELPSPRRGFNRIRFEGTVMRSQLHNEITVTFVETGEFLRTELEELGQSGDGESAQEQEEE
jgi:PilZ domain